MSSGAALIILWDAIQASSASSTQMEGNRPVWINLVMEFRHSGGNRTTQSKGLLSNWFSVIGGAAQHGRMAVHEQLEALSSRTGSGGSAEGRDRKEGYRTVMSKW